MVTCPECGAYNSFDADYCKKCGKKLPVDELKKEANNFEKNMEHFAEEMNRFGHELGDSFRRAFEGSQKHDDAESIKKDQKPSRTTSYSSTHHRSHKPWMDRTFGIFSPLISSIIGLIILLFAIQIFFWFGSSINWLNVLASFLQTYLVWFVGLGLISGYNEYLSRKYGEYRFFSPLVGGVCFYYGLFLFTRLLVIFSDGLGIGVLETIADFIFTLRIPLTLLVVLLGYAGVFVHDAKGPWRCPEEHPKTYHSPSGQVRRLYRSGRDKIVGGVCGGIAEYFGIDPVVVRILYLIFLIASFGTMVLLYVALWIIIPRNPQDSWDD